jgi:hypothetical protein
MTWTVDTMRPLVERFDERVRRDMSRFDRLREPAHSRGTVLREPANEADIAQAEERLGVKLPPSYRSFLLISNGAYASALGAETQYRGENQWRHGLLRVAEIEWTVKADPVGVKVWCEEGHVHLDQKNDFLPVAGNPQPVGYYAPYRDGLVITHIHNGTNRLALVPRPGREEWELWDFHWEGAMAHPSLADFLEWFVSRPDWRPRPEDADALVEAYVSGSRYTLGDLAELGDPRAEQLARQRIEEGKADQVVVQLLGKLGNRANIPLLRELYWASEGALRAQTLMALDELGAPDLNDILQNALASDDEPLRYWAQWMADNR